MAGSPVWVLFLYNSVVILIKEFYSFIYGREILIKEEVS